MFGTFSLQFTLDLDLHKLKLILFFFIELKDRAEIRLWKLLKFAIIPFMLLGYGSDYAFGVLCFSVACFSLSSLQFFVFFSISLF